MLCSLGSYNPKCHYSLQKRLPLDSVLRKLNPVHTFTVSFSEIGLMVSNIRSSLWSLWYSLSEILYTCSFPPCLLAYFPYFDKNKIRLTNIPYQLLSAKPIFTKVYMYIVVPEPISTAYFINPFHHSVWLNVYPSIFARQRLRNNVTAARQWVHNQQ
jgi:hypothetical protein